MSQEMGLSQEELAAFFSRVSQSQVLQVYGVYDLVAGAVFRNALFLCAGEPVARRVFSDMVKADPASSPVAAHPQDHALVYLGALSLGTLALMDVNRGKAVSVTSSHLQVVCTGDQV